MNREPQTHFKYDRLDAVFSYLHGGWMMYQCLETPPLFRSANYKLRCFVADNGIVLASKNSPILTDAEKGPLFLHGSYREFDYKPSIVKVRSYDAYAELRDLYMGALLDLAKFCEATHEKFAETRFAKDAGWLLGQEVSDASAS